MEKFRMFFIGIITAFGALIFELLVLIIFPAAAEIFFGKFSLMVIFGVLIEEFFKLAVVFKISKNNSAGGNIFLNSVFMGIGFSSVEIMFNLEKYSGYFAQILPALIGLFLIHTATLLIFGSYFFRVQKPIFPKSLFLFLTAVLIHFLFNLTVLNEINYWLISAGLMIFISFLFFLSLKSPKMSDSLPK